MFFEWDENKRESNLKKHGLDFHDAHFIYTDPEKVTFQSSVNDEKRFMDFSFIDNRLTALIYTVRGENIRIISFRKARHPRETRYYQDRKGN